MPKLKLEALLKKSQSSLTVSTVVDSGCTEPEKTMKCKVWKRGDSRFLQYTGRRKVKGVGVDITDKQLGEIITLIKKYHHKAALERSYSEELDLLSPEARAAKIIEDEKNLEDLSEDMKNSKGSTTAKS